MTGSNPQNFLRSQKLKNHLFQLWIFAKPFERFFIFSKIENGPFSRPIYHQTCLDIGKKSYTTTTKKKKKKKCTSHIFSFMKLHHTLFSNIQTCLVENWGRKWSVFEFWKKSKISQKVLQKSVTEKNDLLLLGRVKSFLGSTPSFSTPNFLSGVSGKGFNFMIASDHKLILRFF